MVKEERIMQVVFDFGSVAYVTVKIYDGKSLNECLKMRSDHIVGAIVDGVYIEI